jgi:hypothetical protein
MTTLAPVSSGMRTRTTMSLTWKERQGQQAPVAVVGPDVQGVVSRVRHGLDFGVIGACQTKGSVSGCVVNFFYLVASTWHASVIMVDV